VAQTNSDYEWWEPLYQLPPRSVLAPMKPMGLDSPYVESLSSYYLRLAHLHQLSPRGLANHLIVAENHNCNAQVLFRPYFNGVGKMPEMWTMKLERLTGLKCLNQLTFSFLKFLLPKRHLCAAKKKWCPVCHDESIGFSEMYERLLWNVGTVTACPKHGIKLVENCVCGHEARLKPVQIIQLPGICMYCGCRLSSESTLDLKKAEENEIQRAKLVSDFIGNRKLVENLNHGIQFGFKDFLMSIINTHTNGNASEFGRILLISKSKISGWLKGTHMPSFPQVVNIAQACDCSIADVYRGEYQHIQKVSSIDHGNLRVISIARKAKTSWKKVTESRLNSFLKQESSFSLTQVAAELNVSIKFLRIHFNSISIKISSKYLANRKKEAEMRFIERCHAYRKTVETLLESGIPPTRRRIEKELKGKIQIVKDRKVLRNILDQAIQAASNPM
jgi:hypothetical protein